MMLTPPASALPLAMNDSETEGSLWVGGILRWASDARL